MARLAQRIKAIRVEPGTLAIFWVVGLEDRTWNPIGLDACSPLGNADETQQRMNQVLAGRLDICWD